MKSNVDFSYQPSRYLKFIHFHANFLNIFLSIIFLILVHMNSNLHYMFNHLEMASENYFDSSFDEASPHDIQQIQTFPSKSLTNKPNELPEYRLKVVNQLR
jgi:hypothetical protein